MCSYAKMKLFVLLFWIGLLNVLECIQCPEHCKSCSSPTNCLQCYPGYKGNTCEEKCSNCKEGTKCKQDTGYCEDSCKVGKSGDSCDIDCNSTCISCERYDKNNCTTCAHDRYGSACSNECPSKCRNSTCNETDGICTDGCATGFWGQWCEKPCLDNCNNCDRNGTCLECANGFSGDDCSIGQNQTPIIVGVVFGVLGLLVLLVFVAIICIKRQNNLITCLHSTWNRMLDCTNQGNIGSEEHTYKDINPTNVTSSQAPIHSRTVNTPKEETETEKLLESSDQTQESNHLPTLKDVKHDTYVLLERVKGNRDTENHDQDENLKTNRPTDDDSQTAANHYITDSNAINYKCINGTDGKPLEYIASFGSFAALKEDKLFWRKVLEKQCSMIVMLIKKDEFKELKEYLRANICQHSDFTIEYNGQKTMTDSYFVRLLHMFKEKQKKKDKVLCVFFEWPTEWNPHKRFLLSEFHKRATEVRKELELNTCPSIVFSSGGVDRCGTYIAFDMLVRENTNIASDPMIQNCLDRLKENGVHINDENTFLQLIGQLLGTRKNAQNS